MSYILNFINKLFFTPQANAVTALDEQVSIALAGEGANSCLNSATQFMGLQT